MTTNEVEQAFYKFWENFVSEMDDKTLDNTFKVLSSYPKALNDMIREEFEYRDIAEILGYREQINND